MSQLYHDAMAIVRNCGKPDLFITMTCNPRWPEIRDALLPNQTAQDRADIVARVFKLKLDAMCHDLFKSHVFGRVVGRVHVMEFQKRGLPHAHILVILHRPRASSSVTTPDSKRPRASPFAITPKPTRPAATAGNESDGTLNHDELPPPPPKRAFGKGNGAKKKFTIASKFM
jgi:hypothetical protein